MSSATTIHDTLSSAWPASIAGIARPWAPAARNSLRTDRAEMMRYLGYHGQKVNSELAERIERCASWLETNVVPRGAYAVFRVATPTEPGALTREDTPFVELCGTALTLPGKDIKHLLNGATWCAVLCCTLGMDLERNLRLTSSQDALEGALLDGAASAFIEVAINALNDEIAHHAHAAGLTCTMRFSPGYGDLPLEIQPRVLAALNAQRLCGLTTTATNLLMPTKSVTAVVGLMPCAVTGLGDTLAQSDRSDTASQTSPNHDSRNGSYPTQATPQPLGCTHTCATCALRDTCLYRKDSHA